MSAATAEGRRAYELLDWANQDPAGRAAEALGKVNDLALSLAGMDKPRALAEVRDVGGILHRLAGITGTKDGKQGKGVAGGHS